MATILKKNTQMNLFTQLTNIELARYIQQIKNSDITNITSEEIEELVKKYREQSVFNYPNQNDLIAVEILLQKEAAYRWLQNQKLQWIDPKTEGFPPIDTLCAILKNDYVYIATLLSTDEWDDRSVNGENETCVDAYIILPQITNTKQ